MELNLGRTKKIPLTYFIKYKKRERVMYIKLDREYEVKTTLGTIREIEKIFDKSFFEIVELAGTMKVEEQIKFLYAGVKKANPDMLEARFFELCEDNVGMGDLIEYLEKYILALQYPGLTEEEVHTKIEKKLQEAKALQKGKSKAG